MAKSNADLLAMKAELASDPSTLGYTGNEYEDSDSVNAQRGSISIERFDIPVPEIAQAIRQSEFIALTVANRQYLDLILRGETLDARTGTEARVGLLTLFGTGSQTRNNLQALLTRDGSRAEQLYQTGTLKVRDSWTPSDIAHARDLV